MRPEEALTHRLRHALTNVIGGRPGVEGEIVKLRLHDGDRFSIAPTACTGRSATRR